MNRDLVLVTGMSGFVAKHVALAALRAGYRVRGTVRSAAKGERAIRTLTAHGADASGIEVVEADLLRDNGWSDAARGCRYVLHTASPFPRRILRNKFALVPEARDGTLRVLRAAADAGAERVVVTSSVAAVYYGHDRSMTRFTEADFSNVESSEIGPYAVSKTLAERAAWEFAGTRGMALSVINPSVVFGPLLDDEFGTSVGLVRTLMRGRMPFVPRLSLGVVDVRDVAAAHIAAMTSTGAAGRRFIVSAGMLTMMEIAEAVADGVPSVRGRLPKMMLPDAAVRLASLFLSEATQALPELGRKKELVADAARNILGVTFLPPRVAVTATAEGLRERKLA